MCALALWWPQADTRPLRREKDGAKAAARRDVERLPWAEEVLVTRADLEERRVHMAELEQKVRREGC